MWLQKHSKNFLKKSSFSKCNNNNYKNNNKNTTTTTTTTENNNDKKNTSRHLLSKLKDEMFYATCFIHIGTIYAPESGKVSASLKILTMTDHTVKYKT